MTTGGIDEYRLDQQEFGELVSLMKKAGPNSHKTLLLSLLTKKELADITRRVAVANLILHGFTYEEIQKRAGCSKNTVSLVRKSLLMYDGMLARLLDPKIKWDSTEQIFINRLRRGK